MKILIGADPEVFIRRRSDKKLVSAHDLLPGTKDNPYAVLGGALQVDGVAGEFNIDPADTSGVFLSNCQHVLGQLQDHIGVEFETSIQPVAIFDKKYWETVPENAKVLGCTPDYNAWTGQQNPRPNCSNKPTMRTAAGHVHISWGDKGDPEDPIWQADCCLIGRQMDFYVGMISLMWDDDTLRRSLYGKAGAIRFKPYGVEYRSMSNAWLRNAEYTKFIFHAIYQGMRQIIEEGFQAEDHFGNLAEFCINNSVKWWTPVGVKKIREAGYISEPDDEADLSSYFSSLNLNTPPFAQKLMKAA